MIIFAISSIVTSLFIFAFTIKKNRKKIYKEEINKKLILGMRLTAYLLLIYALYIFIGVYILGIAIAYWFATISILSVIPAVVFGRI